MAKILILIGGHLCTAPRAQKEALALYEAGYEVVVIGVWSDEQLINEDKQIIRNERINFRPALDFSPSRMFFNLKTRIGKKIDDHLFLKINRFSPKTLGYGANELLHAARKENADLTIVHSALGLWVADKLINLGYSVGVDFEDWFSEDLLPEPRKCLPINKLKRLEKKIAGQSKYCIATSHAMATGIAEEYDITLPKVVYNVFPAAERISIDKINKDRKNISTLSVHWFSQTVGFGRGLDFFFQALKHLNPSFEIHIRGKSSADVKTRLMNLAPERWRNFIFFHDIVSNNELLSRIAEHDIGLALDSSDVRSRDLTITNKFFQYMQAGLAIIATNTSGQCEIFDKYKDVGLMVKQGDSLDLARAVELFINNPGRLISGKKKSLNAFEKRYSWETEKEVIKNLAGIALYG